LSDSALLIHFIEMKLRERDTTGQLIGDIDAVISVLSDLVNGTTDWADACKLLPAYDGVQAVD
jgi:glycyl-tRNA synthetase